MGLHASLTGNDPRNRSGILDLFWGFNLLSLAFLSSYSMLMRVGGMSVCEFCNACCELVLQLSQAAGFQKVYQGIAAPGSIFSSSDVNF